MKVYGISDLHLPGGQQKPMDIFGAEWNDHPQRIAAAWRRVVQPQDLVLCPGDLSWAMKLEEMTGDLAFLAQLPGKILLIRGNHDLWWKSISKVRRALPPNVHALQNDFYPLPGGRAICGTRGWKCPGSADFTPQDEKIYQRELQRLQLSLDAAHKAGHRVEIVMLHYPPMNENHTASGFTEKMEAADVKLCVYGHLHGNDRKRAFTGNRNGITYRLVACDALNFTPTYLMTVQEN